jgi:cytosine/adenosine deaminase-related metal-dependent hydrolase
MIVRARVVVTMDGPPIENGAVRVRGERIIEVGKFSDLADTDEIADLGDHILLPGLINAHCHLDYTCLRGKIAPPQYGISFHRRSLSARKFYRSPR